ncbi:immunoglobulin domain-containing protein [Streptomyces sp. N35]|uniref:immunoglobulin domain-containing protein n=1 Tax=Streptomyces sp. N35 TaxID=2795730 RepID=UPI0018F4EAD3|nr:immunoglobulin domain-containing protein [Streptomyces sp. N35]
MTSISTPTGRRPNRRRRTAAALTAAALVLGGSVTGLTLSGPAAAADPAGTGLGRSGQKLTVAKSADLDPAGETVHVTGEGYDESKGIYVAFCKDNGDDRVPSPCVGGAATSGGAKSSAWIVPKGDSNAGELATEYGANGSFAVDLELKAKDSGLDCTKVTCSVITRVDHRAAGDRSQDVRIPVTFKGAGPVDPGEGVDVPEGTVSYQADDTFRTRTAGVPRDLLVHPESKKLYVGSDNVPDTADVNESGLYVLDPATGAVRDHIQKGPRANGDIREMTVYRFAGPLAGDGVVFQYFVRGLGTAKDGDENASGVWLPGTTVHDVSAGPSAGSTLIAQGSELSEVETATGVVRRTLTLPGGNRFAFDKERRAVWFADGGATGNKRVYRVNTDTFEVDRTVDVPATGEHERFIEVDPATGSVWYSHGTDVHVLSKDGELIGKVAGDGVDHPQDAAFSGDRAAVAWRDPHPSNNPAADGTDSVMTYDTEKLTEISEPVTFPFISASTSTSVETTDGGAVLYVGDPAGTVTRYVRRTSPRITQAPQDLSVESGDAVTLTAKAEGEPEPTVQWQVSPDGGQTWKNVEGARTGTLDFAAKAAQDGYRYRAEFKNAAGTTRTAAATLTVDAESTTGGSGDGGTTGGSGGEEPNGTGTAGGPEGQQLTVTPVRELAAEDQKIKVSGTGYDEHKGIYVALCVDNGAGEVPTPCVGGADMTGKGGASAWIDSDPPAGHEDATQPFGADGSFEVELTVDAKDEYTDCTKTRCAVVTRADHTAAADRSADVRVPVDFKGGAGSGSGGPDSAGGSDSTGGSSAGSVGGTGTGGPGPGSLASTGVTVASLAGAAALLVAGGWYAVRRTRQREGEADPVS